MPTITLHQFETIDGLMQAVLRRPALEALVPLGRDETVARYYRPEWELFDALVDAFGLDYVNDHASALDCAAFVVAQALLCQIEVVDGECVA